MNTLIKIGLLVVFSLVFLVLVAGIINLLSRSSAQPSRSNMLMRWRVGLQFSAICMLMLVGWLWSQ